MFYEKQCNFWTSKTRCTSSMSGKPDLGFGPNPHKLIKSNTVGSNKPPVSSEIVIDFFTTFKKSSDTANGTCCLLYTSPSPRD